MEEREVKHTLKGSPVGLVWSGRREVVTVRFELLETISLHFIHACTSLSAKACVATFASRF